MPNAGWAILGKKRGDAPQSIPLQAWLLYQPRILLTADMLGALTAFGVWLPVWTIFQSR